MREKEMDILNRAIDSFNAASATLVEYYTALEKRVKFLTEEVDRKKNLLHSIIDSIDVGVIFFDADGFIRVANESARKMLGVTLEEIEGMTDIPATIEDEYILPEKAKPFYAMVFESEVKDSAGNRIGKVMLLNDVTRMRKLEIENERNRRLSAMGELVIKIAHEVRNPLGSIELFANLLSRDLRGSTHGEYANRISQSVRLLVNTLDNMLRFSRDLVPAKEFGLLNDFVREMKDELKELMWSRKVTVHLEEEEMCWLLFDRGLMRQVFINLMLNAVSAMPEGGDIVVKMKLIDSASKVEVSLRDTGEGMDEGTLSRIFEPFFSTRDRGTGLGMPIVKSIVEAHGGEIRVRSEKGKGTEVTLVLPSFEEGVASANKMESYCL